MSKRIRRNVKPYKAKVRLAKEVEGREIWIVEEPHFKVNRLPAMAVRMNSSEVEAAKKEFPALIYRKPYIGEDITGLLINRQSDQVVIDLHSSMKKQQHPVSIPIHEFGSTLGTDD